MVCSLCSADTKIFQEPFCGADHPAHGSPTGLAANWTLHVPALAEMLGRAPNVVGLFLGDEPEIGGLSGAQMCAVATVLKQELAVAGRPDIWLYCACDPAAHRKAYARLRTTVHPNLALLYVLTPLEQS